MHQPDYRHDGDILYMPWVFLHAIKDYYDMPWLLSRYPGLKATFNITPPLIEQIGLYVDKGVSTDRFLTLWLREPMDLSPEERAWVHKICRSSQYDTMVKPLRRFDELYGRERLDDREMVDLEVLFILSWCGNYLRRNDPVVSGLIAKGRGYDAGDKIALMNRLMEFVSEILPLYGRLQEEGKIEVSTTPFNHPILPLLIDMKNAVLSNPSTTIAPNHFSLEEDARLQVKKAIELYRETFGAEPAGFWPAEGAVDEKSLRIYSESGLKWVATDEEILFRTLDDRDRERLYENHSFEGVTIAFRDHGLSDLIGFEYRYRDADEASEDLISHIESIASSKDDATLSIILDGENAWEFYPDNATPFFEALYERLSASTVCRTVTMSEIASMPSKELSRLHPGSWIYGTFDTWAGEREKNDAWELLFQTRMDYERHKTDIGDEKREEITSHLLASECSDWFWWYGDDHYTEYAEEFDRLYRHHLVSVYDLLGIAPPVNLFRPISRRSDIHAMVTKPKFHIAPRINGKVDSFFEWLGSGMIDETQHFSTMDRVRGPVEKIYWGEDDRNIYIRLDGDMERVLSDSLSIRIYIGSVSDMVEISEDSIYESDTVKAVVRSVAEIEISKSAFHEERYAKIRMEIHSPEGIVIQTLPGSGELRIDLNDDYGESWFV